MERTKARWCGLLVSAALAVAGLSACGRDAARSDPPTLGTPSMPTGAAAVRVCHPEAVPRDTQYPSSLYVEGDVRLAAKRTGVIEKVLVDRGARVRAGQPLALLETDVAAPELEMAEHELRLAEADYQRLLRLRGEEVVSPQDFERAEIARDLAASKVRLQRAWLERCTLRAPFDGTVVERWAVPGRRVQEEDDTPLFRIVSSESPRARVDVPEERLGGIQRGSPARVEPAGEHAFLEARVLFVAPAADPASGTVPVVVEIAHPGGFKPGTAVKVRFEADAAGAETLFRLPRGAVAPAGTAAGGEGILFVIEGGKAIARRVRVLESAGATVIVDGVLRPMDSVVVDPPAGLANGAAVDVARAGS
jgi:RND family efflux transporter MFP subunit